MKHRSIAVLLCICLLLCAVPSFEADAADVCFVAINETLLELSYTPYFSGGTTYLPYSVFTNRGFNIYYSYFPEISSAMLYNTGVQLIFDLSNGGAYDSKDQKFDVQAIMRNGVVYVPANFVCNYFGGLSCDFIGGGEYGDVVRIKDGNAAMTDSQFIRAASELMQKRYEAYTGKTSAVVSPELPDNEIIDHGDTTAFISYIGFPDAASLSALKRYNAKVCFFLSSEDVLSSPDTVRKLICEGYSLGVLCMEENAADFEYTAGLIYEVTMSKTLLLTAMGSTADGCAAAAKEMELVFCPYDVNCISSQSDGVNAAEVIAFLDDTTGDSSLFFSSGSSSGYALSTVLSHLISGGYEVRAPRETDKF